MSFFDSPCEVKCTDEVIDNNNFPRLGFLRARHHDLSRGSVRARARPFAGIALPALCHHPDCRMPRGRLGFLGVQRARLAQCHGHHVGFDELLLYRAGPDDRVLGTLCAFPCSWQEPLASQLPFAVRRPGAAHPRAGHLEPLYGLAVHHRRGQLPTRPGQRCGRLFRGRVRVSGLCVAYQPPLP